MVELCPHCGENGLRISLYGLECRCGWSPTVENCALCLCVESCEGHFYGKSEAKNRVFATSGCMTLTPALFVSAVGVVIKQAAQ